MRDNSSRDLRRLITELFEPLWAGPFGDMHSTINQNIIVRNEVAQPIYQPLNRAQVLDGTKAQEIREWRWSAVTSYTVREGRFKGWGIGGSVRWQDAAVIGYDYKDVPEAGGAVLDLTKPYFAPAQTTFDAFLRYTRKFGNRFHWTGSLHARNIGIGNEIVPSFADPDGSISSYRIPRFNSLTDSFLLAGFALFGRGRSSVHRRRNERRERGEDNQHGSELGCFHAATQNGSPVVFSDGKRPPCPRALTSLDEAAERRRKAAESGGTKVAAGAVSRPKLLCLPRSCSTATSQRHAARGLRRACGV